MAERKVIHKGDIGNALHSVAPDHIVTTADEIFDEKRQEYQEDINEIVGSYIDNPEFIKVEIDSNSRIIRAIKTDGTEYLGAGVEIRGDINTDGGIITTLDNPEFSKVYLDHNGRILYGIQKDGNFYFGAGVPKQIQDLIGSIEESLTNLDRSKVDKEDNKGLIPLQYIREIEDDPEFIKVILDNQKRILYGVKTNGDFIFGYGIPSQIKENIDNIYRIYGKYKENVEYVKVYLSRNGEVLWGIKSDGSIYYGAGVPNQIKVYIEERLKTYDDIIDFLDNPEYIHAKVDLNNKILEGIKPDGTKEVNTKVNFKNSIELQNECIESLDTIEYLEVHTDKNNKILSGRTPDGKHFERVGLETSALDVDGNSINTIEDKEGRIQINTDRQSKVISYRRKDGTKVENVGLETPNLKINEKIEMTPKAIRTLIDTLISSGFSVEQLVDWSDKSFINIPVPRHAWVNIICDVPRSSIVYKSGMGTEGVNCDVPAELEFWDMQGNYFKKPIVLSAQGDSSLSYYIKNFGFDFTDGTEVKFGNWVAQDSFHLKKFYQDVFRGQCIVGYRFGEQLYKTRPIGRRRPWNKLTTSESLNPNTPAGNKYDAKLRTGSGNDKFDLNTAALTHPDGFSFTMYWNGVENYDEDKEYTLDTAGWAGIYVWSLKKNRKNYNMDKKDYSAIILDGSLNPTSIWNGTVDWTAFEMRNPKTLHYVAYDNLTQATKNAIDSGKISKYIEVSGVRYYEYDGEYPDEIINFNIEGIDQKGKSASDKKTKVTKAAIERLSGALAAINAESTTEAKRAKFEEYFDVEFFIDYILLVEVLYHYDGLSKNWIWCTWDGIHWCPTIYDLDSIFGVHYTNTFVFPDSPFNTTVEANVWKQMIEDIYRDELNARYAELRNLNIISTRNIEELLKDWLDGIGYEEHKNEIDYCKKLQCDIPSYRESGISNNWAPLYPYNYSRESSNYYNPERTYNFDQNIVICYRDGSDWGCSFVCLAETSQGVSPIEDMITYPRNPHELGFFNSIERICAWLDKRIEVLDTFYSYPQTKPVMFTGNLTAGNILEVDQSEGIVKDAGIASSSISINNN